MTATGRRRDAENDRSTNVPAHASADNDGTVSHDTETAEKAARITAGPAASVRQLIDKVASSRCLSDTRVTVYFARMTRQLEVGRGRGRTGDTEAMVLAQSFEWGSECKNSRFSTGSTGSSTKLQVHRRLSSRCSGRGFILVMSEGTPRLARQLLADPVLALRAGRAALAVRRYKWQAIYATRPSRAPPVNGNSGGGAGISQGAATRSGNEQH